MSADIPPDFEMPWDMADVVLDTEESFGRKLHANKSVLAAFSPYFRALFFHDFKEKNESVVTVKCRFNTMKEILKHIHHVDFDYSSKGHRQYEASMLVNVYRVADLYDFPTVRKLCLDQIKDPNRTDTINAAAELNLRDTVMEILQRQPDSEVKKFFAFTIDYRFSKKELRALYEKITGKPLSKPTNASRPTRRLNLEEFAVEIQNPRIDLTKPWEMADVAIITLNSQERPLYSNKTIIESVSTKFKTLRFISFKGSSIMLTTVDAEYTTMKEILSVIHHCDTNYHGPSRVLHPALLHSMYRVASEDQLDIPMIRDLCAAKILEQTSVDSWEVRLNLHVVKKSYRSIEAMRELIFREDEHLSYRRGKKIVVITPCQREPLFRSDSVLELIDILS